MRLDWRPGLLLALFLAGAAGPATAQNLGKLSFMAGCWQGTLPDGTLVEEWWMPPSDNAMLGLTRYLDKKRATSWEFTVIERADTMTMFIPQTKSEAPDTFRLRTLVDEAAIWEREGEDFPLRIMYRLTSDGSLIARLEGDDRMGQASFELRFLRARCPGR
jgi:hypothetical protein